MDDQEWRARSLESVLGPSGFAVVKAYTGRQSAELAHRMDPDLVIVDFQLSDSTGCDVIRAIRREGPAAAATPCVILSSAPLTKADRRDCLEAGAWDIITPPIDSDDILLKARTYVEAKRRYDAATEQGLLDDETGCYNLKGLVTRIEEFSADAARWHRPLACVVVSYPEGSQRQAEGIPDLAGELRALLRTSDAVGRLPQGELAVLAPATDASGALRLAERIARRQPVDGNGDETHVDDLRIGVYAISGEDATGLQGAPEEVLSRAIKALRTAQKLNDASNRISSFQN